ncbi:dipeptidyl aminopeptidase/acylaminoacyl peptidase [Motilibacter peucedani]|uniref:Dipeptidyl aminopeptidase/acylaminoacyl peptidase n=1 Tax=Motilibacter peucedani TaxID=598650 RepID=A0A420XQ65_9ACTN|nr:prolyl oligopeptidase family serine peptidase [Motilibacter peucedani]RKS75399.1 dipeptidyl aminopeptidase/acylaminoacyl peptidase [Motilibacter peucedani]
MSDTETARELPAWEQRFRAARVSLPDWAQDAPHRCLYVANPTGTFELYAWDRREGTHRQVTSRPNGTSEGTLTPDGEQIWWFDDTDGDEHGVWRVQPFAGGSDEPAAPGLAAAYSAGLALGRSGLAVVGRSDDEIGTEIAAVVPGGEPRVLYRHEQSAYVGDLSDDETLLALAHSEHGDSRHPDVRVVRVSDGSTVAELSDGPGLGLHPAGFAPVAGDTRLLVGHERHGRDELLVWDVATGEVRELAIDLPGEISASWYPDGAALLVDHEFQARSELHRLDLASGELERLETPPGVVSGATARPDGVELAWSSAATPAQVRTLDGAVVLTPPGPPAPPSVPVRDLWVEGPGGRIHALVSLPEGGAAPYPAVFLVHGGPSWHDSDAFAADVAAYVDAGLAVVRVNYRGSTGYGSAWRDAIEGRVGLTELEDLEAVWSAAVSDGLVDAQRVALSGGSWGGYLTLLGLGRLPQLWEAGVGAVPVADYVAAYEDEMEPLKAFDRSLFGGSPEQVPDRYRESSPLTYVEQVRAPVLVLAGENDPRCPIRQIENYLAALESRGVPHEVYRFDAGHGSLVVDERVRQMRAELGFVCRHLGLPTPA